MEIDLSLKTGVLTPVLQVSQLDASCEFPKLVILHCQGMHKSSRK